VIDNKEKQYDFYDELIQLLTAKLPAFGNKTILEFVKENPDEDIIDHALGVLARIYR